MRVGWSLRGTGITSKKSETQHITFQSTASFSAIKKNKYFANAVEYPNE
jgi:hypothetical protein